MNKFKVGDRVAYALTDKYNQYEEKETVHWFVSEYGEAPYYGVITDVIDNNKVMVKWATDWINKKFASGVSSKDLLPEESMKEKVTLLDKEYKEAVNKIKDKMKQAAIIIEESGKIAEMTGNSLANMHGAIDPLINAMDASGWNSSSWGC